jgi:hypothetical protein
VMAATSQKHKTIYSKSAGLNRIPETFRLMYQTGYKPEHARKTRLSYRSAE